MCNSKLIKCITNYSLDNNGISQLHIQAISSYTQRIHSALLKAFCVCKIVRPENTTVYPVPRYFERWYNTVRRPCLRASLQGKTRQDGRWIHSFIGDARYQYGQATPRQRCLIRFRLSSTDVYVGLQSIAWSSLARIKSKLNTATTQVECIVCTRPN